jgi:alkylation response protein AidB-like acyl-CoA dehydrogenase
MDFQLPPEDDSRRQEIRTWLSEHPSPTGRQLAEAGYVVPHWPRPWGVQAGPLEQLLIDDELRRAGVMRPINPIGTGHCGPIIVMAGSEEQKQRYLFPMLAGEEIWCQLFSEPGAGSDLAGVSTRAERANGEYVVNGQKVWTSLGHIAAFGILLARTDPTAAKHNGLSYFIIDMKSPGVEVRPIVEMTGQHLFNEVFFTDVHVPASNLIGEENRGWDLARETLANERITLSRPGAQWGWGPTAQDLVNLVRERGGAPNAVLRQKVVQTWIEGEILRVYGLRTVAEAIGGRPGTMASVRKAFADPHGQHIFRVGKDLTGTNGLLKDQGPLGADPLWWDNGFLFSPALTIGGGTSEVLRDIIGERLLGLPRDPDPDAGRPWLETRSKR